MRRFLGVFLLLVGGVLMADYQEVRERINAKVMAVEAEVPQVWAVEDQLVEREGRVTPVRLYWPSQDPAPVVLLIHGGAWVAGSLDTHDNMARYLCQQAGVRVVSVGYENSPEGKFPGPLEQCYDVLLWLGEEPLAVVGDSAGGNFAAALCLLARDRGGPQIGHQVLLNPNVDLTHEDEELRWQAKMYTDEPENPFASPLLSENLSGLPPALVLVAEHDLLRKGGERYAERLGAELYCQMGTDHLAGQAARASETARPSLDVVVHYLARREMKFSHTIFYVPEVEETLAFFEQAFGLKRRFVHESGAYAELETGGTALAFASEMLGEMNLPDGFAKLGKEPQACEIALMTDDVPAAYKKAVEAGARPLHEPAEKPWGQTVGYLRSPAGLLIELCSPVP